MGNPRDFSDSNAAELLKGLERYGWCTRRIAKGKQRDRGIPDAIVSRIGALRHTHLLEIKRLGNHLSAEQAAFARAWPGCVHVATSSWEANELLKECETNISRLAKG